MASGEGRDNVEVIRRELEVLVGEIQNREIIHVTTFGGEAAGNLTRPTLLCHPTDGCFRQAHREKTNGVQICR